MESSSLNRYYSSVLKQLNYVFPSNESMSSQKENTNKKKWRFFMGLSQLMSLKTKHNSQTAMHIFYQNIRGLKHKIDELMCMLDSCDLNPHIMCLSEHYLVDHKLLMLKPNNYYLASRFSCQSYSGGGVCMYINSYLESNMIDLSQYCIERVIEVWAAQINIGNHFIMHTRVCW